MTLRLEQQEEQEFPRRPADPKPQITHTEVRIPAFPPSHPGLSIVQLTDIHHSLLVSLSEVERVVELVNQCSPDVVALTGDYVTFSPSYTWPVARALGRIRAKQGVLPF